MRGACWATAVASGPLARTEGPNTGGNTCVESTWLVGVVVGEFQSANLGLGYLIVYWSQILKMNIVMTAITLLAIVSSLMYLAIFWLETAVMRRR